MNDPPYGLDRRSPRTSKPAADPQGARFFHTLAGFSWLLTGIPFLEAISSISTGSQPNPALLPIIPAACCAAIFLQWIGDRLRGPIDAPSPACGAERGEA